MSKKEETEDLTTDLYLVLCRTNKLTHEDMAMMTIGMCLEYIETYNEVHHPSQKKKESRNAQQHDFDAF